MKYDLMVTVDRLVTENYKVTVTADSPEEAEDLAFEYFSEYPNGELTPDSNLKVSEETNHVSIVNIEFVEEENTASKVFNDDDNGAA